MKKCSNYKICLNEIIIWVFDDFFWEILLNKYFGKYYTKIH